MSLKVVNSFYVLFCRFYVLYNNKIIGKIRNQVVMYVFKELSNKIIYNDFKAKVVLTEDEIKILDLLLLKCSIIRISQEINMSDRNVSRIIKDIKEKYYMYRKIEVAKLDAFKS